MKKFEAPELEIFRIYMPNILTDISETLPEDGDINLGDNQLPIG